MGLDGPRSEGPGTSQGLDAPEDVSCLGRLAWPTFLLGVWLLLVDHLFEIRFVHFFLIFWHLFLLKNIYFIDFREGGRGEREKHQLIASHMRPPPGGLTCSPGLCPEQGLNPQPFSYEATLQPTWQPGRGIYGIFPQRDPHPRAQPHGFHLPFGAPVCKQAPAVGALLRHGRLKTYKCSRL